MERSNEMIIKLTLWCFQTQSIDCPTPCDCLSLLLPRKIYYLTPPINLSMPSSPKNSSLCGITGNTFNQILVVYIYWPVSVDKEKGDNSPQSIQSFNLPSHENYQLITSSKSGSIRFALPNKHKHRNVFNESHWKLPVRLEASEWTESWTGT